MTVSYNPAPITYNDTSYVNPATFTLSSPSNNLKWYADTLGSPALFSGANFNTPLLTQNTTFYAREIGGPSVFGGPSDNTIGGGGFYNNDRHLYIDCYTSSTLICFDVYAGTSQPITFELRDNNSQVLEDTTIAVQTGLNTLYVNWNVPIMNDLELGISSGNSDLYRNNSGAVYPYSVGNLASITGHNSPFGDPDYHYFFYNLQMMENCKSEFAEATAVFMEPASLFETNNNLKIYPNPTTRYLEVENNEIIEFIRIYNVTSQLVFEEKFNRFSTTLDVSEFSSGIYVIEIQTNNFTYKKEFVISDDVN